MHSLARHHRTFYIFLGVILCAHAAVLVSRISEDFFRRVTPVARVPEPITVKLLSEGMRELALSQRKQIVQSEDSASAEKKAEAFLSDKDRSFERQTVSKNTEIFKKAGKGEAAITQKAAPQEAPEAPEKTADLTTLKLSDIGMPAAPVVAQKVARAPASETTKGLSNGDPLSQGLSATNDYVEEMALGDFTHLNTVEYKFYGFYHRIRQKLEQFWGKSIQEKAANIFRAGRRLPASENLITSLQVTMNEKGEIIKVKILGASGVKELDDAAIESFNAAGPFPNPPKELLVNGKATIDWGFVVKS